MLFSTLAESMVTTLLNHRSIEQDLETPLVEGHGDTLNPDL